MKITDAKVIVTCPSRNFVTLKLTTDTGIYGLGDATLNGREKAVVAYLEEHCVPALLGKDARNIEDLWHYFYRGPYWRRGPVTMAAVSAIDVALWDIKAKALNTPLYNLLGGKSRERVLVYAHATGADLERALDSVAEKVDAGYRAIRVQAGLPGLSKIYGISKTEGAYEPAGRGLAVEEQWDTSKYLNFLPTLFDRVRNRFGEDLHLLHDVHHRLTPIEAARLAKSLEPYHLFWLEDVVACELQEGLRWVRRHSTTPLAIGEVFNTVYDYTTLFTEQLVDYMRMPISHGGGITHLQKAAAFAGIYHIKTGFHGATDLSPVALAAALHFDTAINNFGIQEYMPHDPIVSEVFRTGYRYSDGYMTIDDAPGLGVELDEAAAQRFPYVMASLPVNRLSDGTLYHW
ncbi:MAG TPA: D-mannonate dehydratase ManD [Polyangiaceae bacterium]|nr:D-mannonate dehydratase ManD [Polyangiaceae bacterium]